MDPKGKSLAVVGGSSGGAAGCVTMVPRPPGDWLTLPVEIGEELPLDRTSVWFEANHSVSSESSLRNAYHINHSVRLYEAPEQMISSMGTIVSVGQLDAGLRFPLHGLMGGVLATMGVAPGQLSGNFIRTIICLEKAGRALEHKLGKMDLGVVFGLVGSNRKHYGLESKGTPSFNLSYRSGVPKLFGGMPGNDKQWRKRPIVVGGAWRGPHSSDSIPKWPVKDKHERFEARLKTHHPVSKNTLAKWRDAIMQLMGGADSTRDFKTLGWEAVTRVEYFVFRAESRAAGGHERRPHGDKRKASSSGAQQAAKRPRASIQVQPYVPYATIVARQKADALLLKLTPEERALLEDRNRWNEEQWNRFRAPGAKLGQGGDLAMGGDEDEEMEAEKQRSYWRRRLWEATVDKSERAIQKILDFGDPDMLLALQEAGIAVAHSLDAPLPEDQYGSNLDAGAVESDDSNFENLGDDWDDEGDVVVVQQETQTGGDLYSPLQIVGLPLLPPAARGVRTSSKAAGQPPRPKTKITKDAAPPSAPTIPEERDFRDALEAINSAEIEDAAIQARAGTEGGALTLVGSPPPGLDVIELGAQTPVLPAP